MWVDRRSAIAVEVVLDEAHGIHALVLGEPRFMDRLVDYPIIR
jgi:hypothetical protein